MCKKFDGWFDKSFVPECIKHKVSLVEAQAWGEAFKQDLKTHGLPDWLVLERWAPEYAANMVEIKNMDAEDVKKAAHSLPRFSFGVNESWHPGRLHRLLFAYRLLTAKLAGCCAAHQQACCTVHDCWLLAVTVHMAQLTSCTSATLLVACRLCC